MFFFRTRLQQQPLKGWFTKANFADLFALSFGAMLYSCSQEGGTSPRHKGTIEIERGAMGNEPQTIL